MSDLVSLARSLSQELVGHQEFGTNLEDAVAVCLEYLAREAVESVAEFPQPPRTS